MRIELAGRLDTALTHFAMVGLAGILTESGAAGVRVVAGRQPCPCHRSMGGTSSGGSGADSCEAPHERGVLGTGDNAGRSRGCLALVRHSLWIARAGPSSWPSVQLCSTASLPNWIGE